MTWIELKIGSTLVRLKLMLQIERRKSASILHTMSVRVAKLMQKLLLFNCQGT